MYYTSRQRKMIEEKIYSNTPIDTIISTNEFQNGIEVVGSAGTDILTYRIYDNGMVTER